MKSRTKIHRFVQAFLYAAFLLLAGQSRVTAQTSQEPLKITDLRMSNHTGNSFVISWRTNRPTFNNVLLYGKSSSNLNMIMGDSTISSNKSTVTHYVQLKFLDANTTYYYKVRSDGVEYAISPSGVDTVRTFPQVISLTQLLFIGHVINSSGGRPLERVLVRTYLKSIRPGIGGTTITDSTMWFTSLTDVEGYFQHNLANYRRSTGDLFDYKPGQTWIHIQLLGSAQGIVTDSVLLTATVNDQLQDVGIFSLVDAREALNGRVQAVSPVLANGRSASVVRVTVLDNERKPVPNVEIRLRAATGYAQGVTFRQPTLPTDANGQTWGLVYSIVAEDKVIEAINVSRQDSAALDSTAVVAFVNPPGDIRQDKTPPFIYFTTEFEDNTDNVGPYVITASVVDNFTPVVKLVWSASGNVFKDTLNMTAMAGTDDFKAGIPGQPYNSVVNYFVMASDSAGFKVSSPDSFVSNPFLLPYRFEVLPPGVSTEAKMGINNTTDLMNTTDVSNPKRIDTWVTTLAGVLSASVKWRDINESETFFSVPMEHFGSHYWGSIPARPAGSRVEYFIQVVDSLARTDADHRRAPQADLYNYEVLAAGPRAEPNYVDTTSYLGTPDVRRSKQAVAVDLNGDRYPDVAVANYGEANSVYFYNQYDGALHEATSQALGAQLSSKTTSVVAVDVDADDDLDLVFGNDGQQSRLYINNGKGAFDDVTARETADGAKRMPVGEWSTQMVLADDFNGDNAIDLYLVNKGYSGEVNRLLLNDSLGVFRDVTNLYILNPRADKSVWAISGDVDGDKDTDIVVINQAQNHVVYLNSGKGIFQSREITMAGALALGGELLDVDNDGDLDLVIAQSNTQRKELFLNNGRGVFTFDNTGRLPAESDNTYGVKAFDANMDGYLDLYYLNYNQANRLLLNNRNGTFSEATGLLPSLSGASTSACVADFNQDNRPDIYITMEDRRNVLVYSRSRQINPDDLPRGFSLLAPSNMDTVSAQEITFVWRSSSSRDTADHVRYSFELSLDSLFSASQVLHRYDNLTDTTLAIENLPDNTRYWWRVSAQNSTLSPVYSNSTFSFRMMTSATGGAPEFMVLLSRNPVLTGYMNIYIVSSAPLAANPQLTINLSSVGVTRIGESDIWRGQYYARGGFILAVTGTSLSGKTGEFIQTYSSVLASAGASYSAALPSWIEPVGDEPLEVLIEHGLPPAGQELKRKLENFSLQGMTENGEKYSCESYTFIPLSESRAAGYRVFIRTGKGFDPGLTVCRLEDGRWSALTTFYDESCGAYTAVSETLGSFALLAGMGFSTATMPRSFALAQNAPNPFNPSTTISYRVPDGTADGRVEIKVYNIRGALVRTLADRTHAPGIYAVEWNGRDEGGRELPSGVYFYRLKAGAAVISRKMVLIR